ncbi:MAG: response regulator transcription factor [Flavobacteriales bacterium]|jgi:two-component system invasion response regulator UvrY|nr:response regulator transcription factor [Flavobacteriales bacterium]MBK9513546.1 response regulator transcription factor [Flavobacteriales bacterium]MBP7448446.1 response regulator transcription factor [Flavobacteriales bacterium]HOZ41040.1 response regulator transcription factor [Flavobacteriales bacterium]
MAKSPLVPIAIVDDHILVRKGLVELINGIGGYLVVLEASNGLELVRALEKGPDVQLALVDLNMPVMNGFETLAWMKQHAPSIRPLALTFEGSEEAVVKAVRNGARGFLLKDIEPEVLRFALDRVMEAGYYHTDLVHNSLVNNMDQQTSHERAKAEILAQLSPRELEFLRMLCDPDEHTYEEIGAAMNVHRRTIDGYRETLFRKLGVKSKTGAVVYAVRWGLLS